ncbi:MAG: hypothetical protein PHU75_10005 [Candidatus Nanopelagicales bacterium]|nr:hypothetical protein [Candidatus Nanopelagicales bacterium]
MLQLPAATAHRVAADPSVRVLVDELACCALEVGSAVTTGLLIPELDAHGTARITAVLMSGTVTHALAPSVLAQWQSVPEPKIAIAVGACASSGGPYWDAPTVVTGIADLLPTGGFIAGCPPSPSALIEGLLAIVGPR